MKQSLDEAAYCYATDKTDFRRDVLKEVDSDNYVARKSDCINDFLAGAKWQRKQFTKTNIEESRGIMCIKDRTKVCNQCHECDVYVLNPSY